MIEDVTTSFRRIFHVGTTLFGKKLCLTKMDWEKSFLSLDLKEPLPSLNDLLVTPDAGHVRSFFLVKIGGLTH